MATVATVRQKGIDAVDEGIQALIDAGVAPTGTKTLTQEMAALTAAAASVPALQAQLAAMTTARDVLAAASAAKQTAIDQAQTALQAF
jgi:hypothetical protein